MRWKRYATIAEVTDSLETFSECRAWIAANLLKVMVWIGPEVKQETCFFHLGVSKVRASVRREGKVFSNAGV